MQRLDWEAEVCPQPHPETTENSGKILSWKELGLRELQSSSLGILGKEPVCSRGENKG